MPDKGKSLASFIQTSKIVELNKDPFQKWKPMEKLGDGAFAEVVKVVGKDNQSSEAALKVIKCEGMDESDQQFLRTEISVFKKCKHPYILTLLEGYFFKDSLYLVLELCDGGGLDIVMSKLERGLNEAEVRAVTRQVCEALNYLHGEMILHRDLKASNILLKSNGTIRLADFGVSAIAQPHKLIRHTFIGTPHWIAPEVFVCQDFPSKGYDARCDIWSLGITMIELAEKDPPHSQIAPERLFSKIVKGEPPKVKNASFSKEFLEFLSKCLEKDPESRSSAKELLAHPFLANNNKNDDLMDLCCELFGEVIDEDLGKKSVRSMGSFSNGSSLVLPSPQIKRSLVSAQNTPTGSRNNSPMIGPRKVFRTRNFKVGGVQKTVTATVEMAKSDSGEGWVEASVVEKRRKKAEYQRYVQKLRKDQAKIDKLMSASIDYETRRHRECLQELYKKYDEERLKKEKEMESSRQKIRKRHEQKLKKKSSDVVFSTENDLKDKLYQSDLEKMREIQELRKIWNEKREDEIEKFIELESKTKIETERKVALTKECNESKMYAREMEQLARKQDEERNKLLKSSLVGVEATNSNRRNNFIDFKNFGSVKSISRVSSRSSINLEQDVFDTELNDKMDSKIESLSNAVTGHLENISEVIEKQKKEFAELYHEYEFRLGELQRHRLEQLESLELERQRKIRTFQTDRQISCQNLKLKCENELKELKIRYFEEVKQEQNQADETVSKTAINSQPANSNSNSRSSNTEANTTSF